MPNYQKNIFKFYSKKKKKIVYTQYGKFKYGKYEYII